MYSSHDINFKSERRDHGHGVYATLNDDLTFYNSWSYEVAEYSRDNKVLCVSL